MEEDIKYLDKMVKEYKQFGDLANPEYEDTDRIYKALENLIKGYRELEEKLNGLNTYILINGIDERLKTATRIEIENQSQYLHLKQVERLKERIEEIERNSIPKSKIKEKIEPVIDSLDKNGLVGYADELRDIIDELMEDK